MWSAVVALALTVIAVSAVAPGALAADPWQQLVHKEIQDLLPANQAGGIVVAILADGHTQFYSEGLADLARHRPVTPDSLFNIASLRKPFEAILLAEAIEERRMALDDPVSRYVPELVHGHDIRHVTIGQLATHTSGILLPQDHPPWPTAHYTQASFLETLNDWKADPGRGPGRQHMYTHAGYILLQLALERGFSSSIDQLVDRRILEPLGMSSSMIPLHGEDGRGALPPELMQRAVQGYAASGAPIGAPGDQQTYYDFPGTGQMFSSARDLALFLAANMGDGSPPPELAKAIRTTQTPVVTIASHHAQALAWEVNTALQPSIVEKNGGLNNASSYMAFMPSRRLGIVMLSNRGDQDVAEAGRRLFRALPRHRS
jgi:beta-lactamase class C